MDDSSRMLTSDSIRMLVSSLMQDGKAKLSEIEAERFLNAVARAQLGVPTGAQTPNGQNKEH